MQIRIGPRASQGDAVADLLACHERIRSFTALARRIAGAHAPRAEIADAAARVHRYFAEALPHHVADEEQSLVPRLRGRSIELDAALAAMHGEHAAQSRLEARLVACCAELVAAPERLVTLRDELAAVTADLDAAYAEHLAAEERVVFPALAALPDAERAAVLTEMRARRRDRR